MSLGAAIGAEGNPPERSPWAEEADSHPGHFAHGPNKEMDASDSKPEFAFIDEGMANAKAIARANIPARTSANS